MLLTHLFLLLSFLCQQVANFHRQLGTVSGDNTYFQYVGSSFTWFEAAAAAASPPKCGVEGYLASILSAAEQTAANTETPGSISRYWFGLSDLGTTNEGDFSCIEQFDVPKHLFGHVGHLATVALGHLSVVPIPTGMVVSLTMQIQTEKTALRYF